MHKGTYRQLRSHYKPSSNATGALLVLTNEAPRCPITSKNTLGNHAPLYTRVLRAIHIVESTKRKERVLETFMASRRFYGDGDVRNIYIFLPGFLFLNNCSLHHVGKMGRVHICVLQHQPIYCYTSKTPRTSCIHGVRDRKYEGFGTCGQFPSAHPQCNAKYKQGKGTFC